MGPLIQIILEILYAASTRTQFIGSKTVCNMVKILTLILHNDYLYARIKAMFQGQDIVQTILENLTLPFLLLEPQDIENFLNVFINFNCIFRNQLNSFEGKRTKKIILSDAMHSSLLKQFVIGGQRVLKRQEAGNNMSSQFMSATL